MELSGDIWNPEENGSAATDETLLSCYAKALQNQVDLGPPYVSKILRYCHMICYLVIYFLGGFLNIIVLMLVLKFKKLHTISFALALQIVIINLIIVLVILFFNIVTSIANRWLFGEYVCAIIGAIQFITYVARIVLMLVFVIDRFLNVFLPFPYPKRRLKIVCTLSVIAWLLVLAIAVIMLPGLLDCYEYLPLRKECYPSVHCSTACLTVMNLQACLIVLPSIIVSTVLYSCLFCKAKKAKRELNNSDCDVWRATITFTLMFVALFILIIPFFTWLIIYSVINAFIDTPVWMYIFTGLIFNMVTLIVVMDPIFIMRNRDVKELLSTISWMPRCFL